MRRLYANHLMSLLGGATAANVWSLFVLAVLSAICLGAGLFGRVSAFVLGQSYLALTVDGRAINGMIAAQDPETVTLRNADNQLAVLNRDEIEVLKALNTSLMPDDVLKEMTDQQLRDLFAYLAQGAKKL